MRIFIFILFTLLALQAEARKKPQDPSLLAATHGYAFVYSPKSRLVELPAVSEKDGKQYWLKERKDTGKHNAGSWLPEGSYRIGNWKLPAGSDYPGFKVKAGHVTDLGGLLSVSLGGYETLMLPVNHAENAREIDVVMTEYSAYLKSREPILWRPTLRPASYKQAQPSSGLGLVADLLSTYERNKNKPSLIAGMKEATTTEEFFKITKQVTPPLPQEPGIDAAFNLYFGADLGQIRVRHTDGNWGSIDVQTLHFITAVEFSDKQIFAGSDDGQLRVSNDGGASWLLLKSFGNDEAIIDIDHENNDWVVTTAKRVASLNDAPTLDRLIVYVGKQNDFTDQVISREFPLAHKNLMGWSGANGQLVKGSYYIGTLLELHRLDLKTNEWKVITPPDKVARHYVDKVTGFLSAMSFTKIFISGDQGNTWQKTENPPRFNQDVAFDNKNAGYALRWNMNAFSGDWEIYRYNAAADVWTKTSTAPSNCKPLRVSPKYPLFCISTGASIFSLKNSVWTVEFAAQ